MKKTIVIMSTAVLSVLAVSVNAQETPTTPTTPATAPTTWDARKNPTVDSITSQYTAKYIAPRPALTTADYFPVIGNYESATNADAASVTITLDQENKGLVWIDGLPQGRIKAMLRKSPSTYKIPAQKTEDGKDVPEGTLIFDKETKTLSIAIGRDYNSDDPSLAFAAPAPVEEEPVVKVKKSKVKIKKPAEPKVWIYTGTKVVTETAAN